MQEFESPQETTQNRAQTSQAEYSLPNPDNPPWGVAAALGVWVLSVLAILLFPVIALFPYLALRGIRLNQAEMQQFVLSDPTAVLIQILSVFPAHLITFAAAWLVVTKRKKYKFFASLGWSSGKIRWWHYPLILGLFFLLSAIVGRFIPEHETDLIRILKSSRAALYSVAILSIVTAPLVEEVIYRGLLYSALQRSAGKAFAIVVVTVLFTLVHVPQYYQSVSTILLLAVLSLILTTMRAASGNLLPSYILHLIFNALQSAILLANPEFNTTSGAAGLVRNTNWFY